ncbi:MAG: HIT family protein [Candidatus Bathyarchaeia archaeon]
MSGDCEFCRIASGEAEASVVYENESVIAFLDLYPAGVGHTLVIPKEHWRSISEVPEQVLADVFVVVKLVAVAVTKAVAAEGVNVLQCNGKAAFQSVEHFHVHVIPRFEGDAIAKTIHAMLAPLGFERATRRELDAVAKRIRQYL